MVGRGDFEPVLEAETHWDPVTDTVREERRVVDWDKLPEGEALAHMVRVGEALGVVCRPTGVLLAEPLPLMEGLGETLSAALELMVSEGVGELVNELQPEAEAEAEAEGLKVGAMVVAPGVGEAVAWEEKEGDAEADPVSVPAAVVGTEVGLGVMDTVVLKG